MKNLRRIRAEKGLTMDVLEERTGVSKRTISEIERGMRTPLALTLAKLANALDVNLDDLVEEESPKAQAPHSSEAGEERLTAEDAFKKEAAALKAKYGDNHTLEFMDVPAEEFIALFREAEDVRVKDAGKIVKDLYMGFSGRMAEFMPGEAAQAALRMNQSKEISEALRIMERWIAGVAEEMEEDA